MKETRAPTVRVGVASMQRSAVSARDEVALGDDAAVAPAATPTRSLGKSSAGPAEGCGPCVALLPGLWHASGLARGRRALGHWQVERVAPAMAAVPGDPRSPGQVLLCQATSRFGCLRRPTDLPTAPSVQQLPINCQAVATRAGRAAPTGRHGAAIGRLPACPPPRGMGPRSLGPAGSTRRGIGFFFFCSFSLSLLSGSGRGNFTGTCWARRPAVLPSPQR